MGLFDRFRKEKKNIDNVNLNDVVNMTPEEVNEIIDSVPRSEEGIEKLTKLGERLGTQGKLREDEMFKKMDDEVKKAQDRYNRQTKETEKQIEEMEQRIDRLNNLPGNRRANQVARDEARKLLEEFERRDLNQKKQAVGNTFDEKYFKIIAFLKNKGKNFNWVLLPMELGEFALTAFYEEQKANGINDNSGYEYDNWSIKQQYGNKYDDMNKRNLLSLGILNYLGLLDVDMIRDNPEIFENVIKGLDLSKYEGKDLESIILSISDAIENKRGRSGVLDEFFSDKLPIYDMKNNKGIDKR